MCVDIRLIILYKETLNSPDLSSLASLITDGAVDLVAGVLAVKEPVLVLAFLVYLAHQLLILLQLIVCEENCEGLVLFQDEPLPDDLQKLMESEVERDQIPEKRVVSWVRGLTFAGRGQVTFARTWISR